MKNRTIMYSLIAVLLACSDVSAQGAKTKVPTAVAPYPHIVAEVRLTFQTGPIPTTTLFTPKHSGLFRISGVMDITTPNDQEGVWDTIIGFYSNTGPGTFGQAFQAQSNIASPGVGFDKNLIIRNIGGHSLTYSVACDQSSGDCAGSVYDLFITVEQIQ